MHAARIRIKICGLTRVEDVAAAVAAGADALGFVCYRASPRAVTVAELAVLTAALPPFVTPVVLFVDPQPQEVAAVLAAVPQALVQFHGRESPDFCRQFGRPYLKAIPASDPLTWQRQAEAYRDAAGWLIDTPSPHHGGSGRPFDWSQVLPPNERSRPLILAGGLTPENVASAIAHVRPWAVDVSSGVEAAKGIKDRGKIERFVAAVRVAEAALLGVAPSA